MVYNRAEHWSLLVRSVSSPLSYQISQCSFYFGETKVVNLEKLGSYYRNLVAHGRAYFERGREEAELAEAERIFAACRDAALMLTKSHNNQTSIAIQIHHEIDFDMVVATYLYRWNPEFPPITIEAFRFDHQTKGELLDSTFDASAPLKRVANASLSDTIVKHMQIDKKYVPLLGDLLNCVRINPEFPLGPSTHQNPRTHLERIYYNDYWSIYKDDPPKLLLETGKMLDKLTQRGLHPNAPHLARELE